MGTLQLPGILTFFITRSRRPGKRHGLPCLSGMLVNRGLMVTIGETFGASQRRSVMSHIRVSAQGTWSPQIPRGKADVVVALEPAEAVRVLAASDIPA